MKDRMEYYKKYRIEHLEETKAACRKWYQEHKEEISQHQKSWRKEHPEKAKEIDRKNSQKYYSKHRDGIKERQRNCMRKNYLKINGKLIRVEKRPRPDDICELCGKTAHRLNYHHWNDEHPELGIWICGSCHYFTTQIEHGLHTKYFQLKADVYTTLHSST